MSRSTGAISPTNDLRGLIVLSNMSTFTYIVGSWSLPQK